VATNFAIFGLGIRHGCSGWECLSRQR
jgi:hypothetical protein